MVMRRKRGAARPCRGFTYFVLLFSVASSGVLVAAGATVWRRDAQRDRERELLHVGAEFRRAIGLYYERTPGLVKRYPDTLQALLEDKRYLSRQRYLRRLYRDPITGKAQWGTVTAPDGGIMGIYSQSEAAPLKSGGFDEANKTFAGAARYSAWRFVYTPPPAPAAGGYRPR